MIFFKLTVVIDQRKRSTEKIVAMATMEKFLRGGREISDICCKINSGIKVTALKLPDTDALIIHTPLHAQIISSGEVNIRE